MANLNKDSMNLQRSISKKIYQDILIYQQPNQLQDILPALTVHRKKDQLQRDLLEANIKEEEQFIKYGLLKILGLTSTQKKLKNKALEILTGPLTNLRKKFSFSLSLNSRLLATNVIQMEMIFLRSKKSSKRITLFTMIYIWFNNVINSSKF